MVHVRVEEQSQYASLSYWYAYGPMSPRAAKALKPYIEGLHEASSPGRHITAWISDWPLNGAYGAHLHEPIRDLQWIRDRLRRERMVLAAQEAALVRLEIAAGDEDEAPPVPQGTEGTVPWRE